MIHTFIRAFALFTLVAAPLSAATTPTASDPTRTAWNAPQLPFKVYGNTYYVGTHGLSAILITSRNGHILIDGGLPESAQIIADNIAAAGFHLEDIKYILNSHAHYDHAGGIAELQRQTGARIMGSFPAMAAMVTGSPTREDPQARTADHYPGVPQASPIADGDVIKLGPLQLTAHFTPGHAPGGTTWTWDSCEGQACKHMVYADSLTAVSSPGFKFSADTGGVLAFKHSIATVAALPCDILLTPHPEASNLWSRQDKKNFIDPQACRSYASTAGAAFDKRLSDETK